ncbi:hypothetical protein [Streptomyces mirabilis]|uniref:hypothetical protein n=1 Tax=Streptomyces mirabilis TaxID=68239 RepID=UPI0033A9ABED
MELGLHVTIVTDRTAAFTDEGVLAARINDPMYVHAMLRTDEVIDPITVPAISTG